VAKFGRVAAEPPDVSTLGEIGDALMSRQTWDGDVRVVRERSSDWKQPWPGTAYCNTKGSDMAILLALLLVALLFGLGCAIKVLWLVAVVAFAVWLLGFFVAGAESRWYHW